MRKSAGLLALVTAVLLTPATSQARGYGSKGGVVQTPFGAANTNSPEWRAAGGNPIIYGELMEQKMMMLQEQEYYRQQMLWQKQQQQLAKKKGAGATTGAGSFNRGNTPAFPTTGMPTTLPAAKKKKRTYAPAGKPVGGVKPALNSASGEKKAAPADSAAKSAAAKP